MTEGIEHPVFAEALKPTVAHINILVVFVALAVAEMVRGGVVLIIDGDGVCQAAGGILPAAQQVRDGVAAFHTALPGQQHGAEMKFFQEAHIHHGTDVQNQHRVGEGGGDLLQEDALFIGQIVAALFQYALPVLAGGAADDHHGMVCPFGGFLNLRLLQGHLRVVPGPHAPYAVFNRVLRAPAFVFLSQNLIGLQVLTAAQALQKAPLVGHIHVAAGAVAGAEPVDLHSAEGGNLRAGGEGEHPVFKQYGTLGGGMAQQLRHTGGNGLYGVVMGLLLGKDSQKMGAGIDDLFFQGHKDTSSILISPSSCFHKSTRVTASFSLSMEMRPSSTAARTASYWAA